MYFGFSQILMHCGEYFSAWSDRGVLYLVRYKTHDLAGTWDYIAGIIAMIAAAVIIVALPIKLFSSRQAKYPFSQEEMERFGMSEKAKRLSEPMRVQKK